MKTSLGTVGKGVGLKRKRRTDNMKIESRRLNRRASEREDGRKKTGRIGVKQMEGAIK